MSFFGKCFKKMSLKICLIFSFIVLIVLSVGAVLFVTQKEYSRQMIQELYNAELNNLKSKCLSIDEGMKSYEELTVKIFADSDIRRVLSLDAEEEAREYASNLLLLKNRLNSLAFQRYFMDITSIVLVSPNKIYSQYDIGGNISSYENDFYERLKEKSGRLVLFDTAEYPHFKSQNLNTFAMGRLIIGDDMEEIGYEMVFVSDNFFEDSLKNQDVNQESSYYILSDQDGIMYKRKNEKLKLSDEDLIRRVRESDSSYFTVSLEGQNLLIVRQESASTGWLHVSVIELGSVTAGISRTIQRSIVISLVLIGVSVLAALWIVRSVIRPITDMKDVILRISEGDMSLRVPDYRLWELRGLAEYFNFMLDRIERLIRENNQKQEQLRDTEFQVLQAQINPHFLYNTLNSIRWMAIFNGQDRIKQQIDHLTRLLRSVINDTRTERPLEEEIQVLVSYVEIMRVRYCNFTLEMKLEPDTRQCMVPKFIIQPFVENAILHGFSDRSEGGRILITSEFLEGNLVLSIEDNGSGMDQEQWINACVRKVSLTTLGFRTWIRGSRCCMGTGTELPWNPRWGMGRG